MIFHQLFTLRFGEKWKFFRHTWIWPVRGAFEMIIFFSIFFSIFFICSFHFLHFFLEESFFLLCAEGTASSNFHEFHFLLNAIFSSLFHIQFCKQKDFIELQWKNLPGRSLKIKTLSFIPLKYKFRKQIQSRTYLTNEKNQQFLILIRLHTLIFVLAKVEHCLIRASDSLCYRLSQSW